MTETLLELGRSAATSAQELPLIDLDGTVFVQFGIFLVTALVASQFLFKPFLAMMTARGEGIEGAREESIRADEEARAKIADYDAKLSKARATAGNERQKLRAEGTDRERDVVQAAVGKAQDAIGRARQTIEADATKARAELAPKAEDLGRAIAKRLLNREVA